MGIYDANSGDLEVAILTDTNLDFFDLTDLQNPIKSWGTVAGSIMCSFVHSTGRSRVAMAYDLGANGEWRLITQDAVQRDAAWLELEFRYNPTTPLVHVDPVALVAADGLENPGAPEDIYLFHRSFGSCLLLRHTGAGGGPRAFDGTHDPIWLPSGSLSMPNEQTAPDLQYGVQSDDLLGLFPLEWSDGIFVHASGTSTGTEAVDDLLIEMIEMLPILDEGGLLLTYELLLTVELPPATTATDGYNAIQVAVWLEHVEGAGLDENESNLVCPILDVNSASRRKQVAIPLSEILVGPQDQPTTVAGLHVFPVVRWIKSDLDPLNPTTSLPAAQSILGLRVQNSAAECSTLPQLLQPCAAYLESLPTSSTAVALDKVLPTEGGETVGARITQQRNRPTTGNPPRQPAILGPGAFDA